MGRQLRRSTTGILLELARAPRHAWTPARAWGWQRVARSLSPAQRSATAMTMDDSIFFENVARKSGNWEGFCTHGEGCSKSMCRVNPTTDEEIPFGLPFFS